MAKHVACVCTYLDFVRFAASDFKEHILCPILSILQKYNMLPTPETFSVIYNVTFCDSQNSYNPYKYQFDYDQCPYTLNRPLNHFYLYYEFCHMYTACSVALSCVSVISLKPPFNSGHGRQVDALC